jgi:hypothetical protein
MLLKPLTWIGCAALLAVTLPARAQSAEANLLFDEARSAMAKRDFASAATKLEQSQQLEPAVGTLLNLAECYAELGRTTSAWSSYRAAASLASSSKQLDRERYATRKAQELEPKLSRLQVSIPAEARAPGLVVSRNGVSIPEALWDSAIPVDPGVQHLDARAPGREPWQRDVMVGAAAARERVEVPPLAPLPAEVPTAPAAPAPAPPPASAPLAAAPAPGLVRHVASSPLPTVGWITIGAGALIAGVGGTFYAVGRSKISDANCPNEICVRGVGNKDLHDEGRANEKLGGALAIVGGAALTAGIVVLLTAPKNDPAPLEIGLRAQGPGVELIGAW